MKRFIYLLIGMSVITKIPAQEKLLTLEDLIPGGNTHSLFTPKTRYNVKWQGDDLIFYDEKETFIANPADPDKKELFTEPEEPVKIEAGWENADVCPENKKVAFTLQNNLYLATNEDQTLIVAEDSNPDIVYGQAAHRNEFGIKKGTFWSPQGNYLAFYRMDESMVGDYPLVDISAREAELKNIKYPMAGMLSHEVTVGIYSVQSGQTVYLQTGKPKDHYLTNISWEPSEKYIYIAELNRRQNHLQLNKYSVETGEKVLTLFEERNDRYI
jgi:dipeptidyl-peptidase-4